jgi:Ca2+/Na+ antiporter
MAISLLLLIALSVAVVVLTRVVVRGIELWSAAGGMSAKAKGQFLGYATSLPELVGTVGTASHGLLSAGLWNVGASNIINVVLFSSAALYYGRGKAMFRWKFADEGSFALLALVVPIFLSRQEAYARSPLTAALLLGLFGLYLFADRKFNPSPPASMVAQPDDQNASKARALGLIVSGVVGIVLAGTYLGDEATVVVEQIGVPEWGVGWILGFITSLPEMTAFFAVFQSGRALAAGDDTDCQENLDSLTSSNMSNLGVIYPVGVMVFLYFTS